MFIPIGTDAPIYHWPKATVALIVLNVALLFAIPPSSSHDFDDEDGGATASRTLFERGSLTLGDGLHPVEWVTHFFLHIGAGHLVGNMVFLWAFGIVVEGKLGMLRFLAVYLAIGILSGAANQVFFLWSGFHGSAVGASAVIFGLLALCMFWAPVNEMSTLFIMTSFGFRVWVKQFELRYTWVAVFYIGEQILFLVLSPVRSAPPITELAHLTGACWGSLIAIIMLKNDWVDCEGWDLFSRWNKNKKLAKDWKRREERLDRSQKAERRVLKKRTVAEDEAEGPSPQERSANALNKVRKLIEMGDFPSAVSAYDKAARVLPGWPSGPELMDLIKAMHSQKAMVESLPLMRDYCRKHPETAARMQLKMSQVLIRDRERPTHALRVLREIQGGTLPANLEAVRKQLIQQAEELQQEGVLELEGDD